MHDPVVALLAAPLGERALAAHPVSVAAIASLGVVVLANRLPRLLNVVLVEALGPALNDEAAPAKAPSDLAHETEHLGALTSFLRFLPLLTVDHG